MKTCILIILSLVFGLLLSPLTATAFAAAVVIFGAVISLSYYEGMQHKIKGIK